MEWRSKKTSGWVNFPLKTSDLEDSMEGGLIVKLVVCGNPAFDKKFGLCCGVAVYDVLEEALIADDCRPYPADRPTETIEDVEAFYDERRKWLAYHYPRVSSESADTENYVSRRYLASIVLGATDWSGINPDTGLYWGCTYDDLTEEGKALYHQIQALYPGCDLHLLTFLDT